MAVAADANIRGYKTFAADLKRTLKRFGPEQAEAILRKTALDILRGVVLRTPVKTGLARGNWQLTIKRAATGVVGRDTTGARTIARGLAAMRRFKLGNPIWLTNNVFYVEYLENGTDRMRPRRMLANTIRQVGAQFK